jgi:hypothetical protein
MTKERQSLPKNAAKVEFITHAETIRSMLDEGYNLRNIYNKLRELQHLSMSYFTLCFWYRRTFKEDRKKERTKPARVAENRQVIPARPQRTLGIIKAETKSFPDPRTMNPNDSF